MFHNVDKLREHALSPWNFDTLPGNNPSNWPQGLDKFIERLESLPMLSLFNEPFDLNNQFKSRLEQFISDTVAKIKSSKESNSNKPEVTHLREALYALILVAFHTGSFVEFLNAIRILHETHKKLAEFDTQIAESLAKRLSPVLEEIKLLSGKSPYLHYINVLCNEGGFKISNVAHFQKQSFLNSSMTTDGAYIYLYISAANGGMYKIGTGERGTVPGRVYLYAAVSKLEEVCWVYVKGKLYLRNSSREFGTLEIIDPETFKMTGLVQIYCPDIFGHQSMQMINKNFPLLTDGEYLYIIGKKLLSEKMDADKLGEDEKLKGRKPTQEKEEGDNKQERKDSAISQDRSPKASEELSRKHSSEPQEGDIKQKSPKNEEKAPEGESKPEQKSEEPKLQQENADSKPVESKPEEQKVPEEKAEENKSEGQKPSEVENQEDQKLVEVKAEEPKQEEQKPVENKPEEQKPEGEKAEESKPAEDKDEQSQPSEQKSEDQKPEESKPQEIKIEKVEKALAQENQPKKEAPESQEKQAKAEEKKERLKARRKSTKTKKETKDEVDTTLKLCEYILYEFDTEKTRGNNGLGKDEPLDKVLVQELYEGFNGFFTIEECAQALSYSKDDVQTAAQWLADEGEKERSKLTMVVRNQTLLAQAEVTSDISTKTLKNNADFVTKDDSLILPNQVSHCIWTMDKHQVALYAEGGIEVFSKNPNDVQILNELSKREKQLNVASMSINALNSRGGHQFEYQPPSFLTGKAQPTGFGFQESSSEVFGKSTNIFNPNASNPFEKSPFRDVEPSDKPSSIFGSNTQPSGLSNMFESTAKIEPVDLKLPNDQGLDFKPIDPSQQSFGFGSRLIGESKESTESKNPFGEFSWRGSQPAEGEKKKEEKKEKEEPAEEEKQKKEKVQVQLKGTHLKTVATTRRSFCMNPNIHICYDPYNKKYYTFNWVSMSNSNVFPSLITISFDNHRYEESHLHHLPIEYAKQITAAPLGTLKDLSTRLIYELLSVQSRRFAFPWRLRNWEYVYGHALNELSNKRHDGGGLFSGGEGRGGGLLKGGDGGGDGDMMPNESEEAEKKRIASQKNKLTQRLNKILEFFPVEEATEESESPATETAPKKKVIKELRKDYAFSIDGSYDSLKIFFPYVRDALQTLIAGVQAEDLKKVHESETALMLKLMFYWIKHSDFVFLYHHEKVEELEQLETLLFNFLSSTKTDLLKKDEALSSLYSLGWRIVVNGWELLVRTSKKMYKWLTLILQASRNHHGIQLGDEGQKIQYDFINRDNLQPIVYFYLKYGHNPDSIKPEFPLRDYQIECIKKTANIFKFDKQPTDNTGPGSFIKKSQAAKVTETTLIEPYGRLLLRDLKYLEGVKPQEGNFEDYFPAYFIEENQPKPEPKKEVPAEKEIIKAKKDKKKEKENQKAKVADTQKATKVEPGTKVPFAKKKSVTIDPEVIKAHQEACDKFWEILEESLLRAVDSPTFENLCVVKIFFKLFLDTTVEFEKMENDEKEWNYKLPFIIRITTTLERMIDLFTTKFNDPKVSTNMKTSANYSNLCEMISIFVSSVSYIVYQSCVTRNFGSEGLGHLFVNLLEKFSTLAQIVTKNGEKINLLDHIMAKNAEGIDHLNEKVFETNHPYERGKHSSFEPCSYPGALALSVELDKRCQSDQTQDFLTITSWYDSQFSSFGFFMHHRDSVGSSFRISGKPNLRKPLILMGNNIQVDFSSSPHNKDERSLNCWGFRVRIKPIYRFSRFALKNSNLSNFLKDVEDRFGGSKNFKLYLSAMTLCSLVALEIAEFHIRGTPLAKEEKKLENYLKWNIVKSGLGSVSISDFLAKKDELYHFIEPLKYLGDQDQQVQDQSEKFREEESDEPLAIRSLALAERKIEEEKVQPKVEPQELFKITNPSLKTYLQEIDDQKGAFLDVVSIVRQKVKEPQNLFIEKRRPTFKPELKKLWDKAESYTILALIYHSGLLKFIKEQQDDERTADQIKHIGTTRNEVLTWMLSQTQSEKEWQFLLEEVSECRNSYLKELREAEEAKKKEAEEAAQKAQKAEEKPKKAEPVKIEPKVEIKKVGGKILVSTGTKKKKATKPLTKRPIKGKEPVPQDEEEKKESESEEETKSASGDKKKAKETKPSQPDFDEKVEEKIFKLLSDRFVGNPDSLKMICSLHKINHEQEINDALKEVQNVCKSTLSSMKKDEQNQFILQFKSPYEIVANRVIASSTFLLKLSPNVGRNEDFPESPTKAGGNISRLESILDDFLDPLEAKQPALGRSFSTNVESQIQDTGVKEKIGVFREWIDTYKKWKEWQLGEVNENEYFYSSTANPLKAIVALIKSKVDTNEIEVCLKNQLQRSGLRIIGLQLCMRLLDKVKSTPFDRYLVGLFTQELSEDCLTNITCVPESYKTILSELIFEITTKLIQNFCTKYQDIIGIKLKNVSSLIHKIRTGNASISLWEGLTEQYLVSFSSNLRDIIALLSNEKILSRFVGGKYENEENRALFDRFFENVLQILLLSHSLQFLSLNFEQLVLVAQSYIQNVTLLMSKIRNAPFPLLQAQLVGVLVAILKKELGLKNPPATEKYSLNARILHRCNDIVSIERINSLFSHIYELVSTLGVSKLQHSIARELGFVSYFVIYQHEAPSVISAATKVARLISEAIRLDQFKTPYDIDYMYLFHKDYESLQKALKSQTHQDIDLEDLETKTIAVSAPKTVLKGFHLNNYFSIMEKLGRLVLNQKDEGISFRNIIGNNNLLHHDLYEEKEQKTLVMLHLANEEDMTFLVRVFYYWQELYPTFTKEYPQTYEEYKKYKEEQIKKEAEAKPKSNEKPIGKQILPGQAPPVEKFRTQEKLLQNIPDVNLITLDEQDLNVGWECTMLDSMTDCKMKRQESKRSKSKKGPMKKMWNNANLSKLEKKLEEAAKSIEEPKEEDSEEDKLQFVKAKMFLERMQKHLNEAYQVCGLLNLFGFSPILSELPKETALELANLVNLGIQNRLKPINVDNFKEEIRKKIDPNNLTLPDEKPQPVTKKLKSQAVVSLCESSIVSSFENNHELVTSLSPSKDSLYTDANKITVIHYAIKSGNSTSLLVNQLTNFLRELLSHEEIKAAVFPQLLQYFDILNEKNIDQLEEFDRQLLVATFVLIGGWVDLAKPGSDITANIDIPDSCMIQGGIVSGKKICTLIAKNDPSANIQIIPLEQIRPRLQIQWPHDLIIQPQKLITSFKKIVEFYTNSGKIGQEEYFTPSVLMRALLKLCSTMDWVQMLHDATLDKQQIVDFISLLFSLSKDCPVDRSADHFDQLYTEAWEHFIDKKDARNQMYYFPSSFSAPKGKTYEFEQEPPKETAEPTEEQKDPKPSKGELTLPRSYYLSSLPDSLPQVENKLLKHWEKHIIPRVQDYVRPSLKPWEFDDFFEQIRQPLRVGDQGKAAEITYIICDQRLPSGVTLPDAHHDWSTMTAEEISLGTWAIASIANRQGKLYSQFFSFQKGIGNTDVPVQIMALDAKSSSVLVNYNDWDNNQLVSLWLPVVALKFPDIPMRLPSSSYTASEILEYYTNYSQKSIALGARSVLLRFFDHRSSDIETLKLESSLLHDYKLSLIDIIYWSVLDELGDDSVEGWLKVNEWHISNVSNEANSKKTTTTPAEIAKIAASRVKPDSKNAQKLHALQQFLNYKATFDKDADIDRMISWLSTEFEKMVTFINKNNAVFELQKSHDEPESFDNIDLLNSFLPNIKSDDSISALSLSFYSQASLCMCSGLKFYSDPTGVSIINHQAAGRESKNTLPSLIFNQSNIWYSYYFNAEALPLYQQKLVNSFLPVALYAIPSKWSVCFWLADALTNAQLLSKKKEHLDAMRKVVQIIIAALKQFEGPLNLKHYLFILLNRVMKKVRCLIESIPEFSTVGKNLTQDELIEEHFNLIGISKGWVIGLVDHVKLLKESQHGEVLVLYSCYTKEIIELIINCLMPLNNFNKPYNIPPKLVSELNIPEWIVATLNVALYTQYFKGEGPISEDLLKESLSSIRIDGQWEKLLMVKNLPSKWSVDKIKDLIKDIVVKNHGRILIPSLDITVPTEQVQEGDKMVEKHFEVCLVLIDGWSQLELDEENPEEKTEEQKEQIPEEEEEEKPMAMWACEICTLENPESATFCDGCETPRPPKKLEAAPLEEVKKADFSQLDVQVQQKEKMNIQKMAEMIQESVKAYIEGEQAELAKLEEQEKVERAKRKEAQEKGIVETLKKPENDAEAKRQRNKERKLAQKEAKLKEKEVKRLERENRKKNKQAKQADDADEDQNEEEKKEEGVVKQQQSEASTIQPDQGSTTTETTKTPAGGESSEGPKIETEKTEEKEEPIPEDSPLGQLLKQKQQQKEYVATLKESVVLVGKQISESAQDKFYLEEHLKTRLMAPNSSDLNLEVIKALGAILTTLKKKASSLVEHYKSQVDFIEWDVIEVLEEKDFINIIKGMIDAGLSTAVWKLLELCGYDLWLNNSSFNLIINQYKEFVLPPLKALEQLMHFVQKDLCNESKSVLTYPPSNIRITVNANKLCPSDERTFNYQDQSTFNIKYSELAKFSTQEIRYSWAIIKNFNKNLSDAIPFINLNSGYDHDLNSKWLNLGTYLSAFRNFWLSQIKTELSKRVLQKTALPRERAPKVTLERLKLVKEKETREKEAKENQEKQAEQLTQSATKELVSYKTRDEFVFTKAYEQLKEVSPTLFRPVKPLGTEPFIAFEIVFKGEHVMGEAGPYRQFFADISQELQPNNVSLAAQYKNLNVLCPSPNNASKIGEGRDKYVINPSAKGSYHLQLFEFLGILMGSCVRTDTHFTMDFPSIFWKQLTNQPITVEDLEEIDKPLVDLIRLIGECNKEVSVLSCSLFSNY